jgi:Histidine kinase-, DNA gyrase B-, and HSP90-like ATPase
VKRPGTGLGLPLAKHLAEAHGARFAIDSEVGVGTVVTIVFPRTRLLSQVGLIDSVLVAVALWRTCDIDRRLHH